MADQPFEPLTPAKASRTINRGNQPGRKSVYSQAVELQDTIMTASRNPETTPSALAQLARAWSELEERKRILRMKPKPKDVDVSPEALRRRTDSLRLARVSMITDAPTESPARESPARESKSNGTTKPLQTSGLTTSPPNPLTDPPIESVDEVASPQSPLDLPDDEQQTD